MAEIKELLERRLTPVHYDLIVGILTSYREPDLTIIPGGEVYMVRWHLVPKRKGCGNCYLNVQLSDDQDRYLHDHPWDNTSRILVGGYREYVDISDLEFHNYHDWEAGAVIERKAEMLHRLELLDDYSISLFVTEPQRRDWGFMTPEGWVSHKKLIYHHSQISRILEDLL